MKAIKVLFAVILTATLGLMTSCGGGGGGGGGSDSSDLAPTSLEGKIMEYVNDDLQKETYTFTGPSTLVWTDVDGISVNCSYVYSKMSSGRAHLTVQYNWDGHLTSSNCWQETYTIDFTARDTASAERIIKGGVVDANGNKNNVTEGSKKVVTLTFR